jgi:hypothetical protein
VRLDSESGASDAGDDQPPAWMAEGSSRAVGKTEWRDGSAPEDRSRPGGEHGTRPTLMSRISRLSMDVAGRTTILELATIADSIAVETKSRVPPRFGFKLIIGVIAAASSVLIVTAALAIGWWRWIPVAFLFLSFVAMLSWTVLRSLPKLAVRFGAKEIPGRAAAWLTLGFAVIAGASWGVTLSVSAAAEEVGKAVWPAMAPYMPKKLVALEKKKKREEAPPDEKPKKKPKKARKHWVEPGVLFVPRTFEPVDGQFDLILFFHGNPDIVSEAVPRAGINALVHVTNLGVGSAPYQTKFLVPNAMNDLVAYIEREAHKAGVPKGLKARRIALGSWSAGYGALHSILLFPDQRERVDAVFVLDGIHGGFKPNTERDVDPTTIAPFVKFAEQAVDRNKLMLITHSRIPTHNYTSAKEAADAILDELDMVRTKVGEDDSPPKVKFKAAVNAFPISKRRWLRSRTESHAGNFHVYGFAGNTKEDHIAHLAQMSVTVLPKLKERWAKPPPEPAASAEPEPTTAASASKNPE